MSTPTPPEGYRIVDQSEIPIVPEGAIFLPIGDSAWLRSANIGIEPISASAGTYAIPIAKDEEEPLFVRKLRAQKLELELKSTAQAEIIDGQERAIILKAQSLKEYGAEIGAMREYISKQEQRISDLIASVAISDRANDYKLERINKQSDIIAKLIKAITE